MTRDPKSQTANQVSRNTTMSELRRKAVDMCKPERPYELWLGSESEGRHLLCKEDDERTLEECDTADFSIFSFDQCSSGDTCSSRPVVLKVFPPAPEPRRARTTHLGSRGKDRGWSLQNPTHQRTRP